MRSLKYIFLLIILSFFLSIQEVYATNKPYSSSYVKDCVNDGSCMLLCAYTNTHGNNYKYSSYIYYHHSSKDFKIDVKANKDVLYQFADKKYVHIDDTALSKLGNYGTCPKYSYIENNTMLTVPELCFSNDTEYCETLDDIDTTFSGFSALEYDFNNNLVNNFEDVVEDFKEEKFNCNSVYSNNFSAKKEFDSYLSRTLLHGNDIPSFISSSSIYGTSMDSIDSDLKEFTLKCEEESKEAHEKGNISDEEYLERLDKIDEVIGAAREEIQKAKKETGVADKDIVNIDKSLYGEGCESLLGKPTDPETPAYYISFAFNVLKYVAIVILIVMSVIDFVSATAAQDNDALKKAGNKAIIRFVLCIIIFVLPTLLNLFLDIIHEGNIEQCLEIKNKL